MSKTILVLICGVLIGGCTASGSATLITDSQYSYCEHEAIETCGSVGRLDCHSEVDGPILYFDRASKEVLCKCSWGACRAAGEDETEPCSVEWSCQ